MLLPVAFNEPYLSTPVHAAAITAKRPGHGSRGMGDDTGNAALSSGDDCFRAEQSVTTVPPEVAGGH